MRRWDGRATLVAVCLGLSLGMSGYSVYRAVAPSSPPAPTQVAVQAPEQAVRAQVPDLEVAVPTQIPYHHVGTTMYDEPPVGPKPLVFH